ncbi:DUF4097 family beta strand repeat-containing protein [Hymenobacter rubripertinctus]|uniref:DUF4097 domain-containing protein n=1 Tax=Hymenobacter rubripertinctus TaxID=2029981 RepID=A0A418QUJ2_9BACT|nr:DUF4097 family beta strand repeat-containing protein [Hymenobacter rubripertinctus]RIY08778.1 hypothetical protein D0T11_13665 [Hymenobacter rubripertinctus]
MKKLLLLLLLLPLTTARLRAQEYKTQLSGGNAKVIIEMRDGQVTVEGHDGTDLIIRGNGYEEPDKRAEGLRPLYNSAVDNTRLGLALTREGNTVRIVKASRRDASYTILVPRAADVVYRSMTWGDDDVLLQNLRGRLEVTMKSADVKLLNVTGPVVASSTSGDIVVRYAVLNPGPSAISNISGAIDVALPATTKATLTMRTISGEVYTDFDLTPPKAADAGGLTRVGGQATGGLLNGGGTSISLKNISGNVYVRKAK